MHALLLLCTCGPLTAEEALQRADAAFEGTVMETAAQEAPARKECPPPAEPPAPTVKRKGGCLEGTVRSARTCAPLVGAAIVARAEEGAQVTGVSDRLGRYQICEVPGGAYRLEASFDFAHEEETVTVADGAVRVQHFVMEMSPMEKARLRVERAYKGISEGTPEVAVVTDRNTAACGFGSFEKGQRYLVFASQQRGNYYTGLCDGSKLVSQAKTELGVLRAPRKGGCAGCAAARGAGGRGALAFLLAAFAFVLVRSPRGGGGCADRARGRRPRSGRSSRPSG